MTEDKLNRFLRILNLPIEDGPELFFGKDFSKNNWYLYLLGLEFLTPEAYEHILNGKGKVPLNRALRSYLLEAEKNFELEDDKRTENIIDLGCGYGLLSFWMAQYSGKRIKAIGYPEQISFLSNILPRAILKGLLNPSSEIELVAQPLSNSSILLCDQMESESSDKIILNDVIEHFHPSLYYNLCLASYNSLKKHGVLISKSHNSDNGAVLKRLRKYWSACEKDYLISQRVTYLKESEYSFNSSEIKELAHSTRGYTTAAMNAAAAHYYKYRKPLPLNDTMVPVDLKLDNYMLENYVSPYLLKKYLSFFGYNTRLMPGLQSSRRLSLFSSLGRLMPGILLRIPYFSQVVIIRATKN